MTTLDFYLGLGRYSNVLGKRPFGVARGSIGRHSAARHAGFFDVRQR